ncbi:hypothetical protein GYMLUDRAFT_64352 [Collybiopsis luxurians FD-317 M1]|uniref:Cyclin N-terminal domain-containing protein n=1 Tax=Collybiopsis luxurians FD-317 M1 TaxID=944289 RepID=A0A0D0BRG6_9AGAR|nr:hypothetical protein GYMLUDRAFT_64352 [Collybiopsis luxurians FD-317 M1]
MAFVSESLVAMGACTATVLASLTYLSRVQRHTPSLYKQYSLKAIWLGALMIAIHRFEKELKGEEKYAELSTFSGREIEQIMCDMFSVILCDGEMADSDLSPHCNALFPGIGW